MIIRARGRSGKRLLRVKLSSVEGILKFPSHNRFIEVGYDNCVSVPNGAVMKVVDGKIDPESDNKFRFLWNAKDVLENVEKIINACPIVTGKHSRSYRNQLL